MGVPSLDLFNRSQYPTAPVRVSLSVTTAKSAQLGVGLYWITADADCSIKQGATSVTAATTDIPLWSKTYMSLYVDDTTANGFVAGIVASGTATLHIFKAE